MSTSQSGRKPLKERSIAMNLETKRLIITEFTPDMAESVHLNSLDADNRRFVPDEVFETVEEAAENLASVKVMERCGFTKLYEGTGRYQGQERQICRFVFWKN